MAPGTRHQALLSQPPRHDPQAPGIVAELVPGALGALDLVLLGWNVGQRVLQLGRLILELGRLETEREEAVYLRLELLGAVDEKIAVLQRLADALLVRARLRPPRPLVFDGLLLPGLGGVGRRLQDRLRTGPAGVILFKIAEKSVALLERDLEALPLVCVDDHRWCDGGTRGGETDLVQGDRIDPTVGDERHAPIV